MANTIWQWFQENEATAGGVTDKIKSYMARQGYVAATNEMLYNWLKDLGYSITLNEMLAKFEEENPSMIDGFIKSEANVFSTVSSDYTFSRTGNQTGINSSTQIYVATTGIPAYISGQGILLEGARTNLLTYSRDMTNAAWPKTDVTAARTQTGADGAASSACLMTEGSAGTASTDQPGATIIAGSTVTGSFILKRGNTDWVRLKVRDYIGGVDACNAWFNLATGTAGAATPAGAATAASNAISSLGNGWYRCTVTVLPNATYTQAAITIQSASANSSNTRVSGATYIVDYAQLEVGPFASSPIETVAAAVTRNATSLSRNWTLPANNFSGQIVFRLGFNKTTTGGNAGIVSFSDGTTSNRLQIYTDSGGSIYYVKSIGGVVSSDLITTTSYTIGQRISLRFRADSTGIYFWFNSEAKDSFTTSINPNSWSPALTQIKLGADAGGTVSSSVNSSIESLKLWHEAKSDEFLAALT